MNSNSMKTSSQPSKSFRLSDFVHRRVHSYALMAMFTVGSVALARSAQAEILYTPTNVTIMANTAHPQGTYGLDLNNDGVIDVTIKVQYWPLVNCRGGGWAPSAEAIEIPATGNGAEGAPPAALKLGDPIGPSQTYHAQSGLVSGFFGCTGKHFGAFIQERYLGLMLHIKGETHYGWVRLNALASSYGATARVTGYAYETTPGKPINAGQTSGTINEMDEDSSGGAYLTNPIPDAVQPVSWGASPSQSLLPFLGSGFRSRIGSCRQKFSKKCVMRRTT